MTRSAYPSLSATVGLLLATLVGGAILAGATMFLFPSWPQILQMALPTELALGAAVLWGVARAGRPWRETLALRPLSGRFLFPLFLVLIGSLTVFSELYLVIQRVVPVPPAFEQALRELLRLDGPVDLAATLVVAVGVAPFLEESLFRGVLLQGLARSRGAGAATVWTAAFFALFHLYNPWQVVPTFFLGLVLGWLVVTTGSLVASVLLHAAFNGLSLGIFAASLRSPEAAPGAVKWVVTGVVAALVLGSLALLVGMRALERETGGGDYGAPRGPGPETEPETGGGQPPAAPREAYVSEPAARRPGPSAARG